MDDYGKMSFGQGMVLLAVFLFFFGLMLAELENTLGRQACERSLHSQYSQC